MSRERKRALWAGIFILGAYAVLAGAITDSKTIVISMEAMSGIMVIAIPLLLLPSFKGRNQAVKGFYLTGKIIEGTIMVIAAFLLLWGDSRAEGIRDLLYQIHAFVFIGSAALLYLLFYQSGNIPRFIAIWGFAAVVSLLFGNIFMALGIEHPLIPLFFPLIITNELFLAFWLIIKGLKTGPPKVRS